LSLRNETGGQSLSIAEFQTDKKIAGSHKLSASGVNVQVDLGPAVRIPAGSALSLRLIRS
jgi:hypothetical protein